MQQNKQLVDQNADLSTKVTEVIACSTSPGKRKKIRLEVSFLQRYVYKHFKYCSSFLKLANVTVLPLKQSWFWDAPLGQYSVYPTLWEWLLHEA